MTQAATPVSASVLGAPGAQGASATPLLIEVPEDPAVRIAFTGRLGASGRPANVSLLVGDAAGVPAARAEALTAAGADLAHAVFMQQVHGGDVAVVTAAAVGRGATAADDAVPAVDALVTHDPEVALVVQTADCVPVILVAPHTGVAAVHAGRGGVVADVVPAAVAALAPEGAHDVVAVIGPAIGGCCYEVPDALAAEVAERVPAAAARTSWGTPSLDLPAAVAAQLHAAGVARVATVGSCTRCDADRWFSHRAASGGAADPGRQAGVVVRARARGASRSATTSSLQSP